MSNGNILFVVAYEGYQPIEYEIPKRVLEGAGYTIITASDLSGSATSKDGSKTKVDVLLSEVAVNHYAGIFFIGGPGALEHLDNQISYTVIKKAAELNKPFGAICISTRILAKAGVLKGRQATGWNGDGQLDDIYQTHGVHYVRQPVVVDENSITATGPDAAQEFGEHILFVLQSGKGGE